jgi:predicted acetyltransferase
MAVSIEPLRAGDAAARTALSRLAFGWTEPADPTRPTPPNEHVMAGYLDGRLAAAATFHEDSHWLGGRRVRMGGVAGVAVAPHLRGHGFARAVLRAGLHLMHRRGEAISSPYPTTGTLYRSLGWGYAGTYAWHRVALGDLPPASALAGHDVTPASFAEARALYDTVAPTSNGWLGRSDRHWTNAEYEHQQAKAAHEAYLVRRDQQVVGFLAFAARRDDGRLEISAGQLFAADRDAYRAIFAFVQSMGSLAQALHTRLPEDVLRSTLDHGHRVVRTSAHPFMTRIIDVHAAIASRGYAPHVTAEVHLDLHDPELACNNGAFVLRVRDGAGTLVAGGKAEVAVGIDELATAYTGGTCSIGPLVGVFAAPSAPSMIDFF